jgi:hypothetical protein
LQAAGAFVRVYSLAGGDSMCCCGHDSARTAGYLQELYFRASGKLFRESTSDAELASARHCT